jgi:hypothetical protein
MRASDRHRNYYRTPSKTMSHAHRITPESLTKLQGPAFDLVHYRVHWRRWSAISRILSETGASDTEMKMGLAKLHGIAIGQADDTEIFFTEDTQQRAEFANDGIVNPTLCQLILTSRMFDTDEDRCKARFEAMLKEGQPSE